MRGRIALSLGVIGMIAAAANAQNTAPWSEDWEGFNVGVDAVCGNGGWECWDEVPSVDADIVASPVHGGTRAVAIADTSDVIAVFKTNGTPNITDGKWELIAWVYVPDETVAPIQNSGFVVQNQYSHNDPGNVYWSVQLRFNNVTNLVLSEFDGATLPLIENEWVRIRVEIDLTTDMDPQGWQRCWYGDNQIYEKTWNCGVGACNPNPDHKFASIDLWAASTPTVYYDDLSLASLGESGCAYSVKKNVKGKKGCNACPQKNDQWVTGDACDDVKDCAKKVKLKNFDCPDGGPGICKKLKGKRSDCLQ